MREPDQPDQPLTAAAGTGPAAEQLLELDTREVGPAAALIVTARGEIDLHTAGRLRATVADALTRLSDLPTAGAPVVVDLTDVTFLASAGLAALVAAARDAHSRREPLRVVVDHTRPVVRPIELAGLDDVLALYRSVEDALQAG
ncbi:MAG TPA: anti-sigma factor antagonist [Pseudonocardia sp.]|nr:anti-sigma factor antagonist [Pseudonocardia sp.]